MLLFLYNEFNTWINDLNLKAGRRHVLNCMYDYIYTMIEFSALFQALLFNSA